MNFPRSARLLTAALAALAFFAGCSKSPEKVKAEQAAELARTTGSVLVKTNLKDAAIKVTPVDGTAGSPREGVANQPLTAVLPGKYTVIATLEGWPEARGEATVQVGQTTTLELDFPLGSLRLESVPAGAEVKLGARELGKTPLVVPQLPAGETSLTLEYPNWPPVTQKVTIVANQETAAAVRLPHGKLVLDSIPAGATVLFNRRPVGTTPLTLDAVPAGARKYSFQLKPFPTIEVALTIVDGKETNYTPALGAFFPLLDPAELLHEVWIPDDRSKITTGFNSTTGIYRPKNDIVKNIHRERLYRNWQLKFFRYTGQVKDYAAGRIEFEDGKGGVAPFRVTALLLKAGASIQKGATVSVYGKLIAVEEPAWPGRTITLELESADLLPEAK
jgi:hypothetical protein